MSFEYTGDEGLRASVEQALARVIDPEMALDILALGLVYGLTVEEKAVQVRITMTSAACPVAGLIIDDVVHELETTLGREVRVDLCWEPPWSPELMSDAARATLE